MDYRYILSVDLGTSFIKSAIYDTEGNCHAMTRAEVKSDNSQPGIFVQHGTEIFDSVLTCIRRVTKEFAGDKRKIGAIGFTGQMAGFMGVDSQWNDITTWSCSLDTRYLPYAESQMRHLRDQFLTISGTNSPLMAPKCEWFVNDFPEKASQVAKYMMISSYVIGKLGQCRIEDAVLGSSYITWTGLADIRRGEWSEELCRKSGISTEVLPKIVGGSEICGYLSNRYADVLGLHSGIPLVAGAGDKIAGCVGSGILHSGDTIFETSSYGAVSCLQQEYRPNPERRDYDAIPAFSKDQYYLHRYLPGSGITLKWFLDTFGSGEAGDSRQQFAEIEKKIAALPCGSEGLMAVGLLGGSAMPLNGEIRGSWVGHTWSHRREHFYRALLESYAYELKLTLDSIHQMYPEWNRYTPIHVIGGGAGSETWVKILADATGSEFVRHSDSDAAMWGTAVLAGKAIGVFDSLEQVSDRIGMRQREERFFPDEKNHLLYEKYAGIYEELKRNLQDIYHQLKN